MAVVLRPQDPPHVVKRQTMSRKAVDKGRLNLLQHRQEWLSLLIRHQMVDPQVQVVGWGEPSLVLVNVEAVGRKERARGRCIAPARPRSEGRCVLCDSP